MTQLDQLSLMEEVEREYPDSDDSGSEVEGEDGEVDPIIEPFDPTKIRVATIASTADLLIARIRNNEIDLSPDFQRHGGIWNEGAQSRLIESMLIKIPLPAFYVDATDDNQWLVVDGLQRLTTLKRFVIDQTLKLTGMEFLTQFNGKHFEDLPRVYQRRILETQFTVYQIEKGTPAGVKFNIFRRINTGGLPLSAQEIRHALNQGPVIELLRKLAHSPEFKRATNHSIRSERMADMEYALRFLAFVLTSYNDYSAKDFDSFLNDAMKNLNHKPQHDLDALALRFQRAMIAAYELFGVHAFRKPGYPLRPINKPLFEVWSVNLDRLSDVQLQTLIVRKAAVEEKLMQLFESYKFNNAISLSTGNTSKVKYRFSRIENLIAEVLQ